MRRPPVARLRRLASVAAIAFVVAAPTACGPAATAPDGGARTTAASSASVRTPTYLVLRLSERRLYLMQDGPPASVESFPIAIGRDGTETPTGRFQVEEKIEHPDYVQLDPTDRSRVLKRVPPGPGNPLGERWMAITHGDGWTVGIHGTPHPELLGQAVSHGCIRMRNADVIRVYDRVELGTAVFVYP